jgi:hypothetical protein
VQLRVFALLCVASTASAFPTGEQFDQDAVANNGGGGIAFDGAPRFAGHTCEVCHTGAPHEISVRLEADHPELFETGYTPQQQYHLRVVLEHEHAGVQNTATSDVCGSLDPDVPFVPCNDNGFALELDDQNGAVTGAVNYFSANACTTKQPDDPMTVTMMTGSVVQEQHAGRTAWDLCWTAPAAGTGNVTAFVAVVDGNGGTGTRAFPNDTINDDVAAGAVPIAEAGGAPSPNAGGCSAGGAPGVALLLVVLAFAGKRKRLLAAVLAVAAASGCAHVRPRQREALARRNMTFAPDPAEDELDLHMQESREGSSGGYGSSGGGCGCN